MDVTEVMDRLRQSLYCVGHEPPRPAHRTNKSIDSARAEVEALRAALCAAETRAAAAEAKVTDAQAQIAALALMIEKLRRALYARRSERKERLLGQLELELTARAAEDDLAGETAPGRTTGVKGFERRRPSRKPFPEHLPRERVVVPSPTSCTCCGSKRLSKVGEDVRLNPRERRTTAKRAALWYFREIETLRRTLIQRAGRIIRPAGKLILSMNSNARLEGDLRHALAILNASA